MNVEKLLDVVESLAKGEKPHYTDVNAMKGDSPYGSRLDYLEEQVEVLQEKIKELEKNI